MAEIELNNELFEKGERSYEKQIYEFSHLSEDEFEETHHGSLPPSDSNDSAFRMKRAVLDAAQCKNLPKSKDWNEMQRVPSVKDQKKCGSCYIFASTSAIESAVAIEYGIQPLNMSRQHLLDCVNNSNASNHNGCNPGRPEWIWKLAKDEGGLVQETKGIEYKGFPNKECNRKAKKASFTDVSHWERVVTFGSPEEAEEQIKCRLATAGPMYVGLTLMKNDLGSFKSGIYKDPEGNCSASARINHGLLLVGFGERLLIGNRKPTKYWILQNSWSERWGEQGYLNIERGKGVCNFGKDDYLPVLKKTLKTINKPFACWESADLFDANDNYMKSLCLIHEERRREKSQMICIKNGMQLFKTAAKEAHGSLLNYANKKWNRKNHEFRPFVDGITLEASGSHICQHIKNQNERF